MQTQSIPTTLSSVLRASLFCFALTCSCIAGTSGNFAIAQIDAERVFAAKVEPILTSKCLSCHGEEATKREGGFSVSNRESLVQGGDSGQPSIISGSGLSSPLVLAISRTHDAWSAMPPKESERLNPEEINAIVKWIDAGAPWLDSERMKKVREQMSEESATNDLDATVSLHTSGGTSQSWSNRLYKRSDVWAYQPLSRPTIAQDGPKAIDELIALRMPEGLKPAPAAKASDFIRRATLDLTGLPPTAKEIEVFEHQYLVDPDKAVSTLVDRLLASPHYGERMAQHWLDVVRYADSSGLANDYERGNAWRYRDYVIRSFNMDKPFDQFATEQIAGDEIDPANPEFLIATGFLRMGPWELTGMEVPKVARQRFLDDVTNSVGETFLGHSLQCARCHDHKFDPIPTRDYYSVQAVFATTQFAEREAPFLDWENQSGFGEARFLSRREEDYIATLERLNAIQIEAAEEWFRKEKLPSDDWHRELARLSKLPPSDSAEQTKGRVDTFAKARESLRKKGSGEEHVPPVHIGFGPQEHGHYRLAKKGLERIRWQQDRYLPLAFSVYSGPTPNRKNMLAPPRMPKNPEANAELEQTSILAGGDPFSPAAQVTPGFLSVVSDLGVSMPDSMAGRRTALAQWIVHPANPLTVRVLANRIWMWHFGDAIAGNPNNFGATGKKPTHPELLDWLASKLISNRWSIKSMHRLIMNSQAYRRSCQHPKPSKLLELDPNRSSYAAFRPRRLTAEELRDATLLSTGELNLAIGGIPCRPEINLEAAMQPRQVMGTFAEAWVPNALPHHRNRRSIYTLKLRGVVDPSQEVFNAPASDFSCERRETTLITPQIYSLFHSRQSYLRSLQLARRALGEGNESNQAIVDRLFLFALGRTPDDAERHAATEHWQDMEKVRAQEPIQLEGQPLVIHREAVEENTGEKFQFDEKLYENEEFVADIDIKSCDARTMALAEIALVLFNSNEFIYVY
ncbi:PSD1 and planctomycete cytochrome C domain-containing protein [Pirellulaceae bacterium SH501]|jgi:mono/diheme cytochrome c family protein